MSLPMKIILIRRYNTAAPKIQSLSSGGRVSRYSLFLFSLLSLFLLFIAHYNLIKRDFFRRSKETEGYKAEIHEMTLREKIAFM